MTEEVRILAHRSAARIIDGELTRRGFLAASTAAGVAAVLAACSPAGVEGRLPQATGGKLESQLSMYSWGDYDAPEVLKAYTSKLGPTIKMSSFGSNEEMIAKLVAAKGTSGYDIVVPTGVFIPQMVENKLLEKFNKDLIPNIKYMDSAFLGRQWDPDNKYSVCKAWGTTGFVYDKSVITRELKTWNDFLDAAQNEASGKTSMLDDPAGADRRVLLGQRHRLEHDRQEAAGCGRGVPRQQAGQARLGVQLLPGQRCDPAVVAGPHPRVERRRPPGDDDQQGARQVAVGARRPEHRAVDGQLGHRGRGAASRGRPRVHQLRADPGERAQGGRLHRLPHRREGHPGQGREGEDGEARHGLLHPRAARHDAHRRR